MFYNVFVTFLRNRTVSKKSFSERDSHSWINLELWFKRNGIAECYPKMSNIDRLDFFETKLKHLFETWLFVLYSTLIWNLNSVFDRKKMVEK